MINIYEYLALHNNLCVIGGVLSVAAFIEVALLARCNLLHLRQVWVVGLGPFSLPYSSFSLPFSGRSPDMTEILLTKDLSLNFINQFNYNHLKKESISSIKV